MVIGDAKSVAFVVCPRSEGNSEYLFNGVFGLLARPINEW
jgi:hypothetical protein